MCHLGGKKFHLAEKKYPGPPLKGKGEKKSPPEFRRTFSLVMRGYIQAVVSVVGVSVFTGVDGGRFVNEGGRTNVCFSVFPFTNSNGPKVLVSTPRPDMVTMRAAA